MTISKQARSAGRRWSLAAVLLSSVIALGAADPAAAGPAGEATFVSPERAAEALATAWRGGQASQLLAIFGPEGQDLVRSGDAIAETRARERLAAAYDQRHRIERAGAGEAVLVVGKEDWPYPIPIVRRGATWRFDVTAGARQILDRRIGHNELNAIEASRAFVVAERDYAAGHSVAGTPEYARKVLSTGGQQDGLYWPAKANEAQSPLGPLVAAAEAQGYRAASGEGRTPFHGYFFRILTGQGEHASGGAKSYLADGHMTQGFALIAFPAAWGASGVMTFIVNQNGIVFERNLGRDTAKLARQTALYDPDRTWRIASTSGPL